MKLRAHSTPRHARRGSALVLAMMALAVVAALSLGLLQINDAVTRRQAHAVDDMRAFYIAEAGLSEAYFGLMTGQTGQIGSLEAPALAGDGLVWVDAIEEAEGLVRLRSTGLCQAGRSTLEIVVRREETPLGIFADEGIELTTPFLVDGYDAEAAPYYEQATGYGKVIVDPTRDYKYGRDTNGEFLLYYDGYYYGVVDHDLDTLTFYYDHFAQVDNSGSGSGEDIVFGTGGDVALDSDAAALDGSTTTDGTTSGPSVGTSEPLFPGTVGVLGPTTGVGGVLGSNGAITLSSNDTPIEIYGDIVPGVDQATDLGWGVSVTGATEPREEALELMPVMVPDVDMLPGFVHDSAIPRVLPPAEVGYDSISVAPGSELVVQGQGDLVVGDLFLQDGGAMTVENGTGPVNLYVTDSADLVTGSSVTVESNEPSDLSLQGAATALALNLRATSQFHGMVYAPDSHVAVGRDFEIFGMLVGNTLEIDPMARLHFDSGVLGDSGAVPMPRLVSWRIEEIPAAVSQSRIDPFTLLQLNKDDLEDFTDAHEQASWFVVIEHWSHGTPLANYEGPLEQWIPPEGATRAIFQELTPPEEGAADWFLHFNYRKSGGETGLIGGGGGGSSGVYSGEPGGMTLPLWVYEIYEFRVDPPVK